MAARWHGALPDGNDDTAVPALNCYCCPSQAIPGQRSTLQDEVVFFSSHLTGPPHYRVCTAFSRNHDYHALALRVPVRATWSSLHARYHTLHELGTTTVPRFCLECSGVRCIARSLYARYPDQWLSRLSTAAAAAAAAAAASAAAAAVALGTVGWCAEVQETRKLWRAEQTWWGFYTLKASCSCALLRTTKCRCWLVQCCHSFSKASCSCALPRTTKCRCRYSAVLVCLYRERHNSGAVFIKIP